MHVKTLRAYTLDLHVAIVRKRKDERQILQYLKKEPERGQLTAAKSVY